MQIAAGAGPLLRSEAGTMLIYQSTKEGFLADNRDRMIEDVVA
jgi:hypothetical protein